MFVNFRKNNFLTFSILGEFPKTPMTIFLWLRYFFSTKIFLHKNRNQKFHKRNYVRNHVSKRLKPVPSKNIENWRSFRDLRERSQRKIVIGVFGDSPKMEKVRKLFFQKSKGNYHTFVLIPHLCILGLRGLCSAFTNIIYAKIANRLVPPLSGVFLPFIFCDNVIRGHLGVKIIFCVWPLL